ncbi:MAG: hypothetical protein FJ313_07165 [Gemmatimonadetes bacterium]|nr:hypothetical protein [Gemmatimonadota bacterium]
MSEEMGEDRADGTDDTPRDTPREDDAAEREEPAPEIECDYVPPAGVVGIDPEAPIEDIRPAGEEIRPHRHAIPAALGADVYAIVVDGRPESTETPWTIGLYRFDPAGRELRRVWGDAAGSATDYNSVCWTGEAFVAALPTSRVGVRVLSMSAGGTLLRDPVVLGPDAAYAPAGFGQPPVVVCPEGGPFVIDHGHGAGGTDRLYPLEPDGAYPGGFVDADLPSFSTTAYYASSPCTVVGAEAACATTRGIVFVQRDGSSRASDPVEAPGVCPPGTQCDVARTADGVAMVWTALSEVRIGLSFARIALDGTLAVAPLLVPNVESALVHGIHAASSGATVLVSVPNATLPDSNGKMKFYVFDTSGAQLAAPLETEAGDRSTAPLFWDCDAYAALWIPEGWRPTGTMTYRRFRLVGP